MPLPRAGLLSLETFEDRTLPSGGFSDHAHAPRAWDAPPAVVRERPPHGEAPGGADGPNHHNGHGPISLSATPTGTEAASNRTTTDRTPTAAAKVPAVAHESASTGAAGGPSANGVATPGINSGGSLPPDDREPAGGTGTLPEAVSSAPTGSLNTVSAAALRAARAAVELPLLWTGAADASPGEYAEVVPEPAAPVPSPHAPSGPRPNEWVPAELSLPVGTPVAGLLGINALQLEGRIDALFGLVAGIDVDAAEGGRWWAWVAAAAALGAGAGYAAWAPRASRPRATQWGEPNGV